MPDIYTIERTECIGNSLPKINSNFSVLNDGVIALQETTQKLRTDVDQLSANAQIYKYNEQAAFYKESNFTYGYSDRYNTPGLSEVWADVFTNTSRDPLRISIQVTGEPKTVLLLGKIHLLIIHHATSVWVRLCRFPSMAPGDKPIEALDYASVDGVHDRATASSLQLQSAYTLQPDVPYIFGLQTFFPRWYDKHFRMTYSSAIVNGWSIEQNGDSLDELSNVVSIYKLNDVQATNKFLDDGKSGKNRIGKNTTRSYRYDEQAMEKQLKNVTSLRAVIV